ncbi:MAG: 2-C-methyl-D-erythritol 4-phosphate cytidylyltransferase [Candidatus Omnitrophica bacterium]|nr:2-C-methyl-D-erythritol 4-phosphate cytidylyltransferase [Candidatus Omnitrophota bacterium]
MITIMTVGAIIVCAGKGKRLGVDKPIVKIKGKPLFYHTFRAFDSHRGIKQIALVLRKEHIEQAKKIIKNKKVLFVEGGALREESVCNGLNALGKTISHVLIHDGARPLVNKKLIDRVLRELKNSDAVIPAILAQDALKQVDNGNVKKTIKKEKIVCVQTPQGFARKLIAQAHKDFGHRKVYDDAQLVELLGKRVKVVCGDVTNIKITYPHDIKLVESVL